MITIKNKQKFNLLALIVFCGCIIVSVIAYARSNYAKPSLYMDKAALQLGVVPSGADVRRLISISNRGNAPLIISQVEASCGCIKRRRMLKNNVIPPGGSEPLEIVFSTPVSKNDIKENIILHTNDPQQPLHNILLTAEVNPTMQMDPPLQNFGIVEEANLPLKQRVVIISNQMNLDEDIVKVKNDSRIVRASITKWKSHGKIYHLDIELPKDSPLGPIDGSLRLTTGNNDEQPYFILGKVVGSVYAEPDEVLLQVDGTHNTFSKEVVLKTEGDEKLQSALLENVSGSLSGIVEVNITKQGANYIVKCAFNIDDKTSVNRRGSILLDIKLMSGKTKKLVIPVMINVIPH